MRKTESFVEIFGPTTLNLTFQARGEVWEETEKEVQGSIGQSSFIYRLKNPTKQQAMRVEFRAIKTSSQILTGANSVTDTTSSSVWIIRAKLEKKFGQTDGRTHKKDLAVLKLKLKPEKFQTPAKNLVFSAQPSNLVS